MMNIVHYESGEPIPEALLEKVIRSRTCNIDYDTLGYISAALFDLEWHAIFADEVPENFQIFEDLALAKRNVDLRYVPPRYMSTFFANSIGCGYSADYYAYMWSEILAADAFTYMQ